jgi:hypothetical protein
VHAYDARAPLHRQYGGGDAGHEALLDRQAGNRAERRLARPAGQQRVAQVQQLALAGEQCEILRHRLAEADAAVQHDAGLIDPQRLQGLRGQLQKR